MIIYKIGDGNLEIKECRLINKRSKKKESIKSNKKKKGKRGEKVNAEVKRKGRRKKNLEISGRKNDEDKDKEEGICEENKESDGCMKCLKENIIDCTENHASSPSDPHFQIITS